MDNLNKQIAGTAMDTMDLEKVRCTPAVRDNCLMSSQIILLSWNDGKQTKEVNNAAQVWNHTFFWNCMKPGGGGESRISLPLVTNMN